VPSPFFEVLEPETQFAGESGVGGGLVGVNEKAEFVLLLRTLSVPSVTQIEAPAVGGVIGEREREAMDIHWGEWGEVRRLSAANARIGKGFTDSVSKQLRTKEL